MKKFGLVLLTVMGFAGCAVEDYVTGNNSSVLFVITDINEGAVLDSDVLVNGTTVLADKAPVTVAVRSKNPNFDTVPQVPMAVFVERYEVRYFRSDGRATQGVDVPYTISGNLTTVVDVTLSGGVTIDMEIVRAAAKLEPPLRNLACSVDDTGKGCLGGQALMLTVMAQVTLHGHTTAGEAVATTGTVQVNFADTSGSAS